MTEVVATPPLARERALKRSRTLSGAWLLSGATVGSGVLAYVYHVLAARTLGPDAYGLVAVLWATMFLLVIVLFRPLEQTASRAIANRVARGDEVRTVLRALLVIYGIVTAGILVAGAITWSIVRERLFLGDDLFVLALLIGLVAYGAAYLMRGICGGLHWFKGYGMLLLADGGTRVAVAAPLVFVASRDLAAGAAAAAAVGSIALPVVAGRRLLRTAFAAGDGPPFGCSSAVAFALPAAVIAAADQVLVNGGPLLVMIGGGENASKLAGIVFAATMLVRIPVFIFQGLATSLLPNLTRLHADDEPALFRRAVLRAAGALAGCGAVIVLGAATLGPATMEIVYGADYATGRLELALLGVGVGCYMATVTFSQALLALDRGTVAAVGWCAAAGVFLAVYAGVPGAALFRVAVAFAVATALAVFLLATTLARRVGRA